jgi:hypothetical protein
MLLTGHADSHAGLSAALGTFMTEHLGHIEVMWAGRLERLYFILSEQCRALAMNASWRHAALKHLQWAAPETRCVFD